MKFLPFALLSLLAVSCASAPPAGPDAPEWDAIPPAIAEGLCGRLKMDALASGPVTIVKVTQPLASARTLGALAGVSKPRARRGGSQPPAPVNRAIPVAVVNGTCNWTSIDVRDVPKHQDEMLVELSAPLPNPYTAGEAGLFARITLGGEHPSWYWIPLIWTGNGWTSRLPLPLSQ